MSEDTNTNTNTDEKWIPDNAENSSENADVVEDTEFQINKIEKRREIDLLSLELLSNSSQYKKYLAKIDPHEFSKRRLNSARLQKHKERVMTMLMDLLDEYNDLESFSSIGNSEIQKQFKSCVEKILDFTECTYYKDKSGNYGSNANEDDMMFDRFDADADTYSYASTKPPSKYSGKKYENDFPISDTAKSFWGKKVAKSNCDPFDTQSFFPKQKK